VIFDVLHGAPGDEFTRLRVPRPSVQPVAESLFEDPKGGFSCRSLSIDLRLKPVVGVIKRGMILPLDHRFDAVCLEEPSEAGRIISFTGGDDR